MSNPPERTPAQEAALKWLENLPPHPYRGESKGDVQRDIWMAAVMHSPAHNGSILSALVGIHADCTSPFARDRDQVLEGIRAHAQAGMAHNMNLVGGPLGQAVSGVALHYAKQAFSGIASDDVLPGAAYIPQVLRDISFSSPTYAASSFSVETLDRLCAEAGVSPNYTQLRELDDALGSGALADTVHDVARLRARGSKVNQYAAIQSVLADIDFSGNIYDGRQFNAAKLDALCVVTGVHPLYSERSNQGSVRTAEGAPDVVVVEGWLAAMRGAVNRVAADRQLSVPADTSGEGPGAAGARGKPQTPDGRAQS